MPPALRPRRLNGSVVLPPSGGGAANLPPEMCMTTGAVIFMILSWTFVLGLTAWSYSRLLSGKRTTAAAEELGKENL